MENALDKLVGKPKIAETRKPGEYRPGDQISVKGMGKAFGVVDEIFEGEVWVTLDKKLDLAKIPVKGISEADLGKQVWFNPIEIELIEDGEEVKKNDLPVNKDPKNDPLLNPADKDTPLYQQEVGDAATIFAAAKGDKTHNLTVLNTMATNGVFMNVKNELGQNPLHVAAKENGKYVSSVIDALIYGGVDKNGMDNVGNRPLDMAEPNSEAEKELKRKGAVDGDTALFANRKRAETGMHVALRKYTGKGNQQTFSDEYIGVISVIKPSRENPNDFFVWLDGENPETDEPRLAANLVQVEPPKPEVESTEFPTVKSEKMNVTESQEMRNMLNLLTEVTNKRS